MNIIVDNRVGGDATLDLTPATARLALELLKSHHRGGFNQQYVQHRCAVVEALKFAHARHKMLSSASPQMPVHEYRLLNDLLELNQIERFKLWISVEHFPHHDRAMLDHAVEWLVMHLEKVTPSDGTDAFVSVDHLEPIFTSGDLKLLHLAIVRAETLQLVHVDTVDLDGPMGPRATVELIPSNRLLREHQKRFRRRKKDANSRSTSTRS